MGYVTRRGVEELTSASSSRYGMGRLADSFPAAQVSQISAAVASLSSAIASVDVNKVNAAMQSLSPAGINTVSGANQQFSSLVQSAVGLLGQMKSDQATMTNQSGPPAQQAFSRASGSVNTALGYVQSLPSSYQSLMSLIASAAAPAPPPPAPAPAPPPPPAPDPVASAPVQPPAPAPVSVPVQVAPSSSYMGPSTAPAPYLGPGAASYPKDLLSSLDLRPPAIDAPASPILPSSMDMPAPTDLSQQVPGGAGALVSSLLLNVRAAEPPPDSGGGLKLLGLGVGLGLLGYFGSRKTKAK